MRQQLVETLTEIAEQDDRLVVLLADFAEYQFRGFKEKFPTRIFNMGIRECAMVGIAAGLALEGLIPVCYTIAPFLLDRAFEFIYDDLCLQNLHSILIGFNGMDDFYGDTHKRHLIIDSLPLNLTVWNCDDAANLDEILRNAHRNELVNYVEIR